MCEAKGRRGLISPVKSTPPNEEDVREAPWL